MKILQNKPIVFGLIFGLVTVSAISAFKGDGTEKPTTTTVSGTGRIIVSEESGLVKDKYGNINFLVGGLKTNSQSENNIFSVLTINPVKQRIKIISMEPASSIDIGGNFQKIKSYLVSDLRPLAETRLGIKIPYYINFDSNTVDRLIGQFNGNVALGGGLNITRFDELLNAIVVSGKPYDSKLLERQNRFILRFIYNEGEINIGTTKSLVSNSNLEDGLKDELSSLPLKTYKFEELNKTYSAGDGFYLSKDGHLQITQQGKENLDIAVQ